MSRERAGDLAIALEVAQTSGGAGAWERRGGRVRGPARVSVAFVPPSASFAQFVPERGKFMLYPSFGRVAHSWGALRRRRRSGRRAHRVHRPETGIKGRFCGGGRGHRSDGGIFGCESDAAVARGGCGSPDCVAPPTWAPGLKKALHGVVPEWQYSNSALAGGMVAAMAHVGLQSPWPLSQPQERRQRRLTGPHCATQLALRPDCWLGRTWAPGSAICTTWPATGRWSGATRPTCGSAPTTRATCACGGEWRRPRAWLAVAAARARGLAIAAVATSTALTRGRRPVRQSATTRATRRR